MHDYLVPPTELKDIDLVSADWKTEYDVTSSLEYMGHDVITLGLHNDLKTIREAIDKYKPHIAFNMMEAFDEISSFEMNIVSYLELLGMPYTGCNPRGMVLSRDKALTKILLADANILTPTFEVFPRGKRLELRKRRDFPLIVKSLTQEASIGIAQASVVHDEIKLHNRIHFVHDTIGTDAIVEQFIQGRELYIGVIGNDRLQAFPIWEMHFNDMPSRLHRIATDRVKWNAGYQRKHGIMTSEATDLPKRTTSRLQNIAKRVYRALKMNGYARMDMRLDTAGNCYVLEANANPQLAYGEDFAESAECAGISYEQLLQKILNAGLRWKPKQFG
tara:strand:+ start:63761 stop:64756 length:996 start_codon:yes stop_codon:yes gene_type:complete